MTESEVNKLSTKIAGISFTQSEAAKVKEGEPITLAMNTDNGGVEYLRADGVRLGYVPKSERKLIKDELVEAGAYKASIEKVTKWSMTKGGDEQIALRVAITV